MKRICFALVLILLLRAGSVVSQEDSLQVAAQAEAAYSAGDYANAINLYEALVAGGARDYRVYFNLGNAYYQARNLGMALLNYRRAQQLAPRDSDVLSSISLVRSHRVDVLGDETPLLDSLAAFSMGFATPDELSWMTFLLWFGLFGLLLAAVVRPDWRSHLRLPIVVVGVLFAVCAVLMGGRLWAEGYRPPAVVVVANAGVVSGAGDDYVEIYRLSAAAELRVLERRGGWVRFVLPDERQGWLPETVIAMI